MGEKIVTIVIPLVASSKTETGQPGGRNSPRLGISSVNISGDGKVTIRFSRPIFKAKIENMLKNDKKRILT